MKKTSSILLLALAVAAVSCSKEAGNNQISSAEGVRSLSANLASAEEVKVSIDGTSYAQTWSAGDEIYLYQPATGAYGTLSTTESGANASFSGKLDTDSPALSGSDPCYFVSPASAVQSFSEGVLVLNVLRDQAGTLDEVGSHNITCSGAVTPSLVDESWSFTSSTAMTNLCPIVKMNVSAGLDIRRIGVCGYESEGSSARHTAGTFGYNPATGAVSQAGTDTEWKYDARAHQKVDGADIELSGDVYIVCKPSVDNDVEKLTFTFYNSESTTVTYEKKPLAAALQNGVIYDLGNITAISFTKEALPACTFSVKAADDTGTLLVSNSGASPTIYYTTDGSLPTTSSTEYTSAGIDLATIGTSHVRVLATKAGYEDSYTNAYVRYHYNPVITEDNTISVNAGEEVSIGFAKLKNTGTTSGDLKFFKNDCRYSFSTKDCKIYATTEYDGYAMWYVKLYVAKTKTRTITINYGESSQTSTSVSGSSSSKKLCWSGSNTHFDVEAGNEISYSHSNASDQATGFVLLEYGFEWPATKLSCEAVSDVNKQNFE